MYQFIPRGIYAAAGGHVRDEMDPRHPFFHVRRRHLQAATAQQGRTGKRQKRKGRKAKPKPGPKRTGRPPERSLWHGRVWLHESMQPSQLVDVVYNASRQGMLGLDPRDERFHQVWRLRNRT